MTLDEAITHAREVAEEQRKECALAWVLDNPNNIKQCAKEHEQLAEWLEELKKRRNEDYGYLSDIHQNIGYRKAIDDLRNELKNHYTEYNIDCVLEDTDFYSYTTACNYLEDYIDEIAEQLKAGGKND